MDPSSLISDKQFNNNQYSFKTKNIMKKILVTALAAMSLVACMQEEVVTAPQTDAIAFEGAFVDNATRAAVDPSTTTASIAGFDVWAFMNESTGTVLVDEDVQKAGGAWGYANTQYWTPLNDYYFAALAPMNSANVTETLASGAEAKLGLGEITFTNVDGSEDLLYAKAYVETPRYEDLKLNNMPPVKFQFQHLLSKVKFTFTNGFLTDNAYVEVVDIMMVAPKTATINLAQADYTKAWELDGTTETYAYGNVAKLSMGAKDESAVERLTIPATETQSYDITFTVKLYMGDQLALETVKTSAVSGVAFEMGKAYNLTAEINPDNLDLPSIEFEVVVEDWEMPYVDVEHPIVATIDNVPYTSLQDAIDDAAGNTTIELVSNVKEDVTITQTTGVNLVINGNGKTYQGTMRVSGQSNYSGAETLVIKDVNFVNYTTEACLDMNWGTSNQTRYAHNITVDGCTFTVAGEGYHVAPAIDMYQPYNVVINDVEVTGAHSLLQVKGGHDGVAVSNVKVTDCKNGIAFGTHDGPVSVTNAEINTLGYGIRADGSVATTLTVTDATIDALRPIVVRKTTGNYNVVLAGNNTLTAGDYYQVILTKGDDEAAYVAPTGAYTITGADAFKVYPTNASDRVSTAAELTAALAGTQAVIELESGAVIEGTFKVNREVTITSFAGNKATIKGRLNVDSHATLTCENIKFAVNDDSKHKNTFTGAQFQYPSIVAINCAATSFEGCEFEASYAAAVCGINYASHAAGKKLVVNNCKFVGDFYAVRSRTLFSITNSEFNVYTTAGTLAAVWTWGNGNPWENEVVFKNNKSTSGKPCYSVQMTASNFTYNNTLIDVQGNEGFNALASGVNPARFNGTHTFAAGSETF